MTIKLNIQKIKTYNMFNFRLITMLTINYIWISVLDKLMLIIWILINIQ